MAIYNIHMTSGISLNTSETISYSNHLPNTDFIIKEDLNFLKNSQDEY